MPSLQLSDDLTIHYQYIQPEGSPVVVLLHGLGVNNESWGMQLPALQDAGFCVLTPDIRGFGKSTCLRGSVSVAHLAGDIVALLQSLKIARSVIVGISMGGAIALQMTIDAPNLVSKLVLINTFACLRPKDPSTWLYFASRFALAHIVGVHAQAYTVANHLFPHPEQAGLRQILIDQIAQANPGGYRAAMRALARFNVSSHLKDIAIPTLVITGDQDQTVPREVQEFLAKNIVGARYEIVVGAGHAVTVEKPSQVNRLLTDFISADC
jgi:3-oxoadipate enol-lactonase